MPQSLPLRARPGVSVPSTRQGSARFPSGRRRRGWLGLSLISLLACADHPAVPQTDTLEALRLGDLSGRRAAALYIQPGNVTLPVGETVQLKVIDANGSSVPASWRSADVNVASVTTTGLLSALLPGSVTVEASSGTAWETATVSVTVLAIEEGTVEDPTRDPPAKDPATEDPPAEDPPTDDSTTEDPPQDPPTEDPPTEDPPTEEPPTEDPPTEDPPTEDPTEDPPTEDPPTPSPSQGIWISPEELASKPTSGASWDNMKRAADTDLRAGALTVRDHHNARVMAAALVAARLDDDGYRSRVRDALRDVMAAPVDDYDALAALRRLGTYAIAADLIGLDAFDPSTGSAFRNWLHTMVRYPFKGGGGSGSVIDYHERRPNNFGTHAGASRMAVAAYLGDDEDFERAVRVFQGWLGDHSAYDGFSWGELDWQCDGQRPVGINAPGCTRGGRSLDGVLPDDQRRSGGFNWPPPKENYVYEALQGALAMAVIAHRRGYPAFEWSDRALLRAFHWLHEQASYPAEGDDTWQPHLVNHYYGTRFPAPLTSRPGKNVGWTAWTH